MASRPRSVNFPWCRILSSNLDPVWLTAERDRGSAPAYLTLDALVSFPTGLRHLVWFSKYTYLVPGFSCALCEYWDVVGPCHMGPDPYSLSLCRKVEALAFLCTGLVWMCV